MKFLFDQSADFRLIEHLRGLGHDVTAISRDYPHSLADENVLAIARRERRILVVADRDFGELIFNQGLAHAGVLFFRLPGAQLQTKIEHLEQALQRHADEMAAGEFVVVTPGNIRITGRPRS
jgi:predicted nuclease of predicted toxin-antitoxin system